jgi:hypothetical protein
VTDNEERRTGTLTVTCLAEICMAKAMIQKRLEIQRIDKNSEYVNEFIKQIVIDLHGTTNRYLNKPCLVEQY